MKKERFTYLINQYANKAISTEEIGELKDLLAELDQSEIPEALCEMWLNESTLMAGEPVDSAETDLYAEQILSIDKQLHTEEEVVINIHPIRRYSWVAAAVVLVLILGGYFWIGNKKTVSQVAVMAKTLDVAPGKNGAILTLANGAQVVLDSLRNGVIALQNGAQVSLTNGQLIYQQTGNATVTVAYNTISTPKGREFNLQLPDGSHVWLNAASSIRYPTTFTGKERNVEVTGEAYFEVAKNQEIPFRVKINEQAAIEVLGTQFNINAYENESAIKTTLLDGSVRVISQQTAVVLKPGQQAQNAQGVIHVISVDVNPVMAWKNGLFNFEGLSLMEAMKQLERWYDIRVQFKGAASKQMFSGKMYRNTNFSDVLEMFKEMGVKYEWDGSMLTIL